MHIPDGFLTAKTLAMAGVLSTAGVAIALSQVKHSLPRSKVPMLGLAGAFVFAAQMLNFPVAAGASGHLIGGVLASVLLGPSAAIIVLTSVLLVQAIVFADGGVFALGANVLNMAVINGVGGYLVYASVSAALRRPLGERVGGLTAVAFASWVGVMASATVCAAMLVASGAARAGVVFPAMLGVHALIGVGEALLTTIVIATVWTSRPELSSRAERFATRRGFASFALYGLLVALALAAFASPFASSSPDGLEKVAETVGFESRAVETPLLPSPLADYSVGGSLPVGVKTAIAGTIGTLVVFALSWLLARSLSKTTRPPSEQAV